MKRFTEKRLFLLEVEQAVDEYNRTRGGATWSEKEQIELAKSAAVSRGLAYQGEPVDEVVNAIRIMGNSTKSMTEGMQSLDMAWEAYRKSGPN